MKLLLLRPLLAVISVSLPLSLFSQSCVFRDTALNLHFGTQSNPEEIRMDFLNNYGYVNESCPNDGFYSYISQTSGCFNNDWHPIMEDHTYGDTDGKFLVVNASQRPGPFFISYPGNLQPDAHYEFRVWLMNVCRTNSGCPPLSPDISISIETESGKKIALFSTGALPRRPEPQWSLFTGMFNTGPKPERLILVMKDVNPGGCGNDFAMDDIMIRRCIPIETSPLKPQPLPINQQQAPVTKPSVTTETEIQEPEKKLVRKKNNMSPVEQASSPKQNQAPTTITERNWNATSTPLPILNRANPVVSSIKTKSGILVVELYDNGQIDGDTVSIYHNRKLVADKVGLSAKPIRLEIAVSKEEPHHELVMVAENLGSIPPNTSLMVVTGNGARKEVFISSSEESNARVLIDLDK